MIDIKQLDAFLDDDGKLKQWPRKREKKRAALLYLAERFEFDRDYTEKEVNAIIEAWHTFQDYFLLRRELVGNDLLRRKRDGSRYWRNTGGIPTTLKHKPVFVVENYSEVDGREAQNNSDAKGLSLGLAQWNDRGRIDVSAKVWRYTGEKWSRQSEELPLHRVLDLALLIVGTKKHLADAYRYPNLYNPEKPQLERIAVQGGAMTLEVCCENPRIDEDIKLFNQAMSEDDELLSERLHRLANALNELGYGRRSLKDGE